MRSVKPNSLVVAEAGKCIGCKACELACFTVHNQGNGVGASVGTVTMPVLPRVYVIRTDSFTMPVQCRQCENAPCAHACPVQAIRQENGIIHINADACIGCKACSLACPFGAISLYKAYGDGAELPQAYLREHRNGRLERKTKVIAYKCDLCRDTDMPGGLAASDRADGDGGIGSKQAARKHPLPACVSVCPAQALKLVHPGSDKLRPAMVAGIHIETNSNGEKKG